MLSQRFDDPFGIINFSAVAAVVVLTLLVGGSLGWSLVHERRQVVDLARAEARATIDKDFAFRFWVIDHGGVYVSPDGKTPPSPYLAHVPERDVVTPSGKRLTLMNSSYVMRQMMERYEELCGTKGHICSLLPLNPVNRADSWEAGALKEFSAGLGEKTELREIDGKPYLRMMRPMYVEQSCLKCHTTAKVGEVRGGVSTSVPMAPYYLLWKRAVQGLVLTHGAIYFLGLAGVGWARRFALNRLKERRQAEEALNRASERMLLYQQQTLLAFIEWNLDFQVVEWNPGAEKIFGYRRDEALGRQSYDLIIPPDVRSQVESVWQSLVHQEGGTQSINENLTKDGRRIVCEWHNTPITDEDGKVIGLVSMAKDITQRRRAEEALQQLNATLEQRIADELAKNREKDHLLIHQSRLAAMGEMVHNIAHQWRQPLNALGLVISNLRDDYRFGELNEAQMNQAVASANRLIQGMSTTIDDFRDFFQPDQEETKFDVGEAVFQTASLVDAALKHNHIALVLDIENGVMAQGFPSQYSQAVLNILVNAKEAIQKRRPAEGRILMRLQREGEWAMLSVEDNGGGIPAETLPKVFDPYFTTKDQGSGIGLYMTKAIIEKNMHGRVAVANIGDGAALTLSVPLCRKGAAVKPGS